MKTKWNEMPVKDKILFLIQMILLAIIIVLYVLKFGGIVEHINSIVLPLIGINISISAFQEWNEDRDVASIHSILAVLAFIITMAIWFK